MLSPLRIIDTSKKIVEESELLVMLVLATLLITCTFASQNIFFSYCSLAGFVFFYIYVLLNAPEAFIKYLFFFVEAFLNVIGCAFCEMTDIYLSELRTQSMYFGSLPLLVLNRWVQLVVIIFLDRRFERAFLQEPSSKTGLNFSIIMLFALFSLMLNSVLLFHVVFNPSFLIGVDRFTYAEMYLGGVWSYLGLAAQYMIVFPIVALCHGKRVLGAIPVVFYLVYLFCIGTKYGSFFSILTAFVLVFFVKIRQLDKKRLRRYALAIIAAVCGLVLVAVIAHSFTSEAKTIDFLYQRGAQEGQLWWGLYGNYQPGEGLRDFGNEINAILEGEKSIRESVGANYGIYKVMYLTAPESIVDGKLASGSAYSDASHAIVYYYFGSFGTIIFSCFAGFLIWLITNCFVKSANLGRVVELIIFYRFYFCLLRFVGSFSLVQFFDPLSILSYVYLIIVGLFFHNRKGMRKIGVSPPSSDKASPVE